MKKYFHREELKYTGAELSSHFAYKNFDIAGDSITAFIGLCDVKKNNLLDLADAKRDAFIFSEKMLHFIVEIFEANLEKAILLQRILVCIIAELVNKKIAGPVLKRINDDIFIDDKKLSVSIATVSPVSSLIHTGLNIRSDNTPVKAIGLDELGIEAESFAEDVCELFIREVESIKAARSKVRGVD